MKQRKADKILTMVVLSLSIFGLIMISSASVVISYNNFGHNYYYLFHQFLYGFLPGMFFLLLFQKIDYRVFKKYAPTLFAIAIIFLLFVFVPGLGHGAKGASRWIEIGNINFQPSEISKLTFILYLAAWFEKRKGHLKSFSGLLVPFVCILAIMTLFLIKQPDIGTLIVIVTTAVVMYFMAGTKLVHIVFLIFVGAAGVFALIKIAPYRMNRLMVFLHPELDPLGIGYQINQALLTIGSGGIFGLGLGHSRQKFNYLPEPMGDSIFAVIGEELGIIGLVVIVALFLLFALRGFKIANKTTDDFGKLVAVGITSWIVFQSLINMAAITSLIPLTGIPLPFISYGGSAMVTSLASVGILLSISRYGISER